jgi:hypothetical protein
MVYLLGLYGASTPLFEIGFFKKGLDANFLLSKFLFLAHNGNLLVQNSTEGFINKVKPIQQLLPFQVAVHLFGKASRSQARSMAISSRSSSVP